MPRPDVHLESVAAERADFARLLQVVRELQHAPLAELCSLDWLHATLCGAGLAMLDGFEEAYGEEAHLVNASHQGIAQLPREFAQWLRLLAEQEVTSYVEIGCHNGATATLATAYLQRFQPSLRALTLDLYPGFLFHSEVQAILPLAYEVPATSFSVRGQVWDAVFIDGDHRFAWAWADYQNIGRHARVCGFHDILSQHYFDLDDLGGITAVWEHLRTAPEAAQAEWHEFAVHPSGQNFGIGARVQRRL